MYNRRCPNYVTQGRDVVTFTCNSTHVLEVIAVQSVGVIEAVRALWPDSEDHLPFSICKQVLRADGSKRRG